MLGRAWAAVKRWWVWVAGILLAIVTLGAVARRKTTELGVVKDELAVQQAVGKVHELQARREEISRQVVVNDSEIASIDAQIQMNQKAIVDAHDVPASMNDEEVASALRKILGS